MKYLPKIHALLLDGEAHSYDELMEAVSVPPEKAVRNYQRKFRRPENIRKPLTEQAELGRRMIVDRMLEDALERGEVAETENGCYRLTDLGITRMFKDWRGKAANAVKHLSQRIKTGRYWIKLVPRNGAVAEPHRLFKEEVKEDDSAVRLPENVRGGGGEG